jgi:hypothetical protein
MVEEVRQQVHDLQAQLKALDSRLESSDAK